MNPENNSPQYPPCHLLGTEIKPQSHNVLGVSLTLVSQRLSETLVTQPWGLSRTPQ